MANFKIKKGLDLSICGEAQKAFENSKTPEIIALNPTEFFAVKPKLLVKVDDSVKGGQPLFFDKNNLSVMFVSPVPGIITNIKYGERRSIQSILIKPDWDGDFVEFGEKTESNINALSRNDAISLLKKSGNFVYIRQRPFDKIPDSERIPKSIFINGMNSAPNAGDPAFILKGREKDIQYGISILKKLTDGKIHLCYDSASNDIFKTLSDIEQHTFSGPHPAGLTGTHIHFIDPIAKGETIWYLDAVHVAAIGAFLKTGTFYNKKTICLSGEGCKNRKYYRTYAGASIESLVRNNLESEEQRIVSGTAIFGDKINRDDYLNFYRSDLQIIPEGRQRHLLGWLMPGLNMFSASSRSFISSILPKKLLHFNTNVKGGKRTIVWTDVYDQVMPLDIYTNFLVKAIIAEDIYEFEALGILEVSDEDFALATYLCPSKIDISLIIRKGLDIIEKEGY